jgi:conjugal transfer mating pair stabilization protein TraG
VANSYGNEDRANISSTFNEIDQASRMLQSRFGLRAELADSIAVESFISGSASVEGGVGANFGVARIGASANLSGGKSKRWSNSDLASVSRDGARIDDALQQWSQTRGWSQNKDSFRRSIVTSGRSDTASTASGISSNMSEALTKSAEAKKFFEAAHRLEERWSVSEGGGVQGSLNTSDSFLQFAREEISSTPLVYQSFDPANATHWASSDPRISSERQLLVARYISRASEAMRRDVQEHLTSPDSAGLASPSTSRGAARQIGLQRSDVHLPHLHSDLQGSVDLLLEVQSTQKQGGQIISHRRAELESRTQGAGSMSREGAKAARDR